MRTTQRTGLRTSPPGGTRSLLVITSVIVGCLLGTSPVLANGHGHKARLSSDLEAIVHGEAAAPADGVDVILTGTSDFIQRLATKHGVQVKRFLKTGAVVTLTHAPGISSTGDTELDPRLPFDEPYRIPAAAADAIRRTTTAGGRIVAVGTTVVRALEDAAARDGIVHAGDGVATRRIGATTRLRVVHAILSGTHEPGSSHYDLLRAFASDATLRRASAELESCGYLTHEFGDSIFIEQRDRRHELSRIARTERSRLCVGDGLQPVARPA